MTQLAKYLGHSWAANIVRRQVAITDWYRLGWQCYWYLPLFALVEYNLLTPKPSLSVTMVVTALTMNVLLVPLTVARRRRYRAAQPQPGTRPSLALVREEAP